MDPPATILKKTCPSELKQNKQALEDLLLASGDMGSIKSFRQTPMTFIPFEAFHDVPDSVEEEKPFLQCSYNQSENSYRSPWTNLWYASSSKVGTKKKGSADEKLRLLEAAANEVWDAYAQLYYGMSVVGSAFLKQPAPGVVEGVFGIQKRTPEASWDTVHVVHFENAAESNSSSFAYKVDSAVVLTMDTLSETKVCCSLDKTTTKTASIRQSNAIGSHLENLGLIMENVEMEFRSKLERVDIPKSIDVMEGAYRKIRGSGTVHLIHELQEEATGMGVGSTMIGEIAAKAQEGSSEEVLEAVEANKKAKEEASKSKQEHGKAFTDMKKTLKAPVSKTPPISPMPTKKESAPAYTDTQKKLKSPVSKTPPISPMPPKKVGAPQEQQADAKKMIKSPVLRTPPASPPKRSSAGAGGDYNEMRAGLRKTVLSPKLVSPTMSPSPEFVDFRNKLKKTGKN